MDMLLSKVVEGLSGTLKSDGTFKRLDYCTVNENGPFLTFMEKEKFLPDLLKNNHISCVLCTQDLLPAIPDSIQGVFVTSEPKACFELIHNKLSCEGSYKLPSFKTVIGKNCDISPLAYISEDSVVISDNVIIEPFSYIGSHVTIGDGCIIHNHVTVGGKSFSYARIGDEDIIGLIDCGTVVLEEGAEVMSYTHIARGILPTDCTRIGRNTVLDAYVHIGHGSQLRNRVFVAAGAIISGNCRIGKDSWIGVNATISNRIVVGERCRVSLGAVVTKDVPDDAVVTGNFAVDHKQFLKDLKDSIR